MENYFNFFAHTKQSGISIIPLEIDSVLARRTIYVFTGNQFFHIFIKIIVSLTLERTKIVLIQNLLWIKMYWF